MLDTNILIYFIKNKPLSVADRINALDQEAILCMSFFTYAELLKGAERSVKKVEVLRQLETLTRQIPVLFEVNRAVCEHYAVRFTRLKAEGTPIGANDLWIACHALATDATLVTNNLREFARVDGLRLDNWATSELRAESP
jgi:tRNA(fMet)-specific endonuclease VapC